MNSITKMLVIIGLLAGMSSCKDKCGMKHYYGMYTGNVIHTDADWQTTSNMYINVMFKESKYKYMNSDSIRAYFSKNETHEVYKVVWKNGDTLIMPINSTLLNNRNVDNPFVDNAKAIMAKGTFGCIPVFIADIHGDVYRIADENNANMVFVPLAFANHETMPADSIITPLTTYNFKMTVTNYNKLNAEYRKDNTIDGGLDFITGSNKHRFKAFKGENELLSFIEED